MPTHRTAATKQTLHPRSASSDFRFSLVGVKAEALDCFAALAMTIQQLTQWVHAKRSEAIQASDFKSVSGLPLPFAPRNDDLFSGFLVTATYIATTNHRIHRIAAPNTTGHPRCSTTTLATACFGC
jgi:hypothetical protein